MRWIRFAWVGVIIGMLMMCNAGETTQKKDGIPKGLFKGKKSIVPGAYRTSAYLPVIKARRVGVLVNHTSRIEGTHLIDTLLKEQVSIRKIFTPEHGFEGTADAGEEVGNSMYKDTDIPVISLFGKQKKPTPQQMEGLDILLYDIQDVGVRFYTYISTMHYAMEACAENGVKFIILDRPNPNGGYIDGPVLDTSRFHSFVGMHPVPVVYGMTPAEYATMINNEGWLSGGKHCVLSVVKMKHYNHQREYRLPVKPSPNLPNYRAVSLYPSLCFFEATPVSIGRGTQVPFQVMGYPNPAYGNYTFTPKSMEGALNPKHEGKTCYGIDLRNDTLYNQMSLKPLIDFYSNWQEENPFFSRERWFNLLAGNDTLIEKIRAGKSHSEIKQSWKQDLEVFKRMRERYLLYRD